VNVEQYVEWELAGEVEVLEENVPIVILSTTNPTWSDLGSNPCRRCRKPTTIRLSDMSLAVSILIENGTLKWETYMNISSVFHTVITSTPDSCRNTVAYPRKSASMYFLYAYTLNAR
jgi:hypothetical protein